MPRDLQLKRCRLVQYYVTALRHSEGGAGNGKCSHGEEAGNVGGGSTASPCGRGSGGGCSGARGGGSARRGCGGRGRSRGGCSGCDRVDASAGNGEADVLLVEVAARSVDALSIVGYTGVIRDSLQVARDVWSGVVGSAQALELESRLGGDVSLEFLVFKSERHSPHCRCWGRRGRYKCTGKSSSAPYTTSVAC